MCYMHTFKLLLPCTQILSLVYIMMLVYTTVCTYVYASCKGSRKRTLSNAHKQVHTHMHLTFMHRVE